MSNQEPHHDFITQKITEVCHSKSLVCLHAIESGSRAWGFASPDSDYDVRLIYRHEPDWYWRIFADTAKDTFEFIQTDLTEMPFDVPFDIGGWDVRKALQLLYKSNAVLFEWLNSPIGYQSDDLFLMQIKAIQADFFDPKACFYHYQGLAKNAQLSLNLAEPIKLKKWFYLLRALLASVWVLERASVPPVVMADMFELISPIECEQIEALIAIKVVQDESYRHTLSAELQALMVKLWQRCDSLIFPDKKQDDVAVLDGIFKSVVFA